MNVDFHVMEGLDREQALRRLCLLLETPYAAKQSVFIYATSANEAEYLDQLLWTYRDNSFLAHQITTDSNDITAPIEIGFQSPLATQNDILVNLGRTIPEFYRQFNSIIEIVFSDPDDQQAARERFRRYREQGCNIHTHKIKVNEA